MKDLAQTAASAEPPPAGPRDLPAPKPASAEPKDAGLAAMDDAMAAAANGKREPNERGFEEL